MAWTEPAVYVAGSVVTASQLNEQVRGNLLHLHGDAGTITLSDGISVTKAAAVVNQFKSSVAGAGIYADVRVVNSVNHYVSFAMTSSTYSGAFITNGPSGEQGVLYTASSQPLVLGTNNSSRMVISGSADAIGFGRINAPAGTVHGHNNYGGFLHWSAYDIGATPQTIVPSSSYDVQYRCTYLYVVRASSGASNGSFSSVAPGNSSDIWNNSGDICRITCAADGSITIARAGGSLTYNVALWLIWI